MKVLKTHIHFALIAYCSVLLRWVLFVISNNIYNEFWNWFIEITTLSGKNYVLQRIIGHPWLDFHFLD